VPKERRRKLDDTAIKCKLLGYSEDQKAYRVMNQATGDAFNSRSVTFKEMDGQPSTTINLSKCQEDYGTNDVKQEHHERQNPLQDYAVSSNTNANDHTIQMYRAMIQGLSICHTEIMKLSDRKMFQGNTNTEICILTYRKDRKWQLLVKVEVKYLMLMTDILTKDMPCSTFDLWMKKAQWMSTALWSVP
jgi:hypothetical protein